MIRYTLRQIEHALCAAEQGSLAKASSLLGLAQPTLSASIMKLEQQLGLQLFIRHHAQGVTPAPQAAAILREARNLLIQARELQRQAEGAGEEVAGDLALGSFTTLAPAYMPQLIAGFRKAHPRANLRLTEATQTGLVEGLRSGALDAALLYKDGLPGDLASCDLATLQPYALLPAEHPLAAQAKVALADLAAQPMILLAIPPSDVYFTGLLREAGFEPKIAFASPSLELVRGLVGQGLGYSLLITRPWGDRAYDGSRLAMRVLSHPVKSGEVALATLKGVRQTRLGKTFEEYAISFFRRFAEGN